MRMEGAEFPGRSKKCFWTWIIPPEALGLSKVELAWFRASPAEMPSFIPPAIYMAHGRRDVGKGFRRVAKRGLSGSGGISEVPSICRPWPNGWSGGKFRSGTSGFANIFSGAFFLGGILAKGRLFPDCSGNRREAFPALRYRRDEDSWKTYGLSAVSRNRNHRRGLTTRLPCGRRGSGCTMRRRYFGAFSGKSAIVPCVRLPGNRPDVGDQTALSQHCPRSRNIISCPLRKRSNMSQIRNSKQLELAYREFSFISGKFRIAVLPQNGLHPFNYSQSLELNSR